MSIMPPESLDIRCWMERDGANVWRCTHAPLDPGTKKYAQCSAPVTKYGQQCPRCHALTTPDRPAAPPATPVAHAYESQGATRADGSQPSQPSHPSRPSRPEVSILGQQMQSIQIIDSAQSPQRSSSRSRGAARQEPPPTFPVDRATCAGVMGSGTRKGCRCGSASDSVGVYGYCGNHVKAFYPNARAI